MVVVSLFNNHFCLLIGKWFSCFCTVYKKTTVYLINALLLDLSLTQISSVEFFSSCLQRFPSQYKNLQQHTICCLFLIDSIHHPNQDGSFFLWTSQRVTDFLGWTILWGDNIFNIPQREKVGFHIVICCNKPYSW